MAKKKINKFEFYYNELKPKKGKMSKEYYNKLLKLKRETEATMYDQENNIYEKGVTIFLTLFGIQVTIFTGEITTKDVLDYSILSMAISALIVAAVTPILLRFYFKARNKAVECKNKILAIEQIIDEYYK